MGGIANSILELLPVLESIKDLKITLITKYTEYKPISRKTQIISLNKFVNSKINNIYFFTRSFFRIIKINKKNQINAIYVPSYYYNSISPLLTRFLFKIPIYIKTPSNFNTLQREVLMFYQRSILQIVLYYGWMKFFKTFVVKKEKIYFQTINNETNVDLLNLGISKKNIIKLPNAISSKKFVGMKKHENTETHFGYVGRLLKSKNVDFLLRVFEKYISKFPNDKLFIFGEGSEKEYLQNFVNKRNISSNIIFRGFEKDKKRIYSNIDVLIHPTLGEGSPNTILESSLTDTFVIASNVSGIKDIVIHKKSGLLFNPFKEDDLLKNLQYYNKNQNLVSVILEAAKNNIIKNYDVNVIAKKIYEFIKSKWMTKSRNGIFKITIITPVFPYPKRGVLPGIERYVESFAIPLKELGVDVKIVTSFWNGGKRYDNYKGIPILRIYESKTLIGKIGSLFHLNYSTFGLNLLRKKNYLFYEDSNALLLPLGLGFTGFLKLKGIPIFSGFLHYDKNLSLIDYLNIPFYHRMEKRQFDKHKRIITISNSSKEDIIKYYGINENHITVFPIGVDTKRFNPSLRSVKIREKYGKTILLYSGPMISRKRVPVLLYAMKRVLKNFPDVKLLLLGDGLYIKKYKKLAKRLKIDNNLVWLGFIDNPEVYYASSDLFVFPSELEGFGQVITESMACGTPVVCADKPPMCEIIGEGGVTFRLNNSKDFANKIMDLLSSPEKLKKLSEGALIRVQKYEWIKVVREIIKYFKAEIKKNS